MVMLRHPGSDDAGTPAADAAPVAGRLNLLISDAGWEPESWADRLPPLLEPMGVRAHRVQSGREAEGVIRTTPVHIAIVDMALPLDRDAGEGGRQLLELLRRLDLFPPTVVIRRRRAHRDEVRELHAALRAGVFAVIDRPVNHAGFEAMLSVLRRALQRYYHDRWPARASPPTQ